MRISAFYLAGISDNAELSVTCVNQGLAHAVDIPFVLHAIADDFRYGEHLHCMSFAKLNQVRHTRHGAVFAHDFADDSGGHQAGHSRQINGSFCLPSPNQDAAFTCSQWKNMTWTCQVGGPGG